MSAPASRATASARVSAWRPSVETGRAARVISACSGGRLLGEASGPEAVVLGEVVEAERLADQRHGLLGAALARRGSGCQRLGDELRVRLVVGASLAHRLEQVVQRDGELLLHLD